MKNNQILSTGYNGSPKGISHCADSGCMRQQQSIPSGTMHELCRGVHAEQNAIIQAGINGSSTKGAVLYCTHQPCSICAKLIINAEIRTVYICERYPDKLGEKLFREAGVELLHYDMEQGSLTRLI